MSTNPVNGSDIASDQLKEWLHDGGEIALIDVREAGEYGEGHLFYAVNTPYSRLELDAIKLIPNPRVRVVVVDDDGGNLSALALTRLDAMGYERLHRLAGGINAWRLSGREIFAGVNVPSKAFGELAEHFFETPRISARALHEKQKSGDPLLVIDGRPFSEYQKMNIPGAVCCPNGELALRIDELVKDEQTTIVINCAGRTRSIIGAQTLINLGLKNPVYALENGTQGWYLEDLVLENGSQRRWGSFDTPATSHQRRAAVEKLTAAYGLPIIEEDQLQQWWADASRTTFLCDVRNPEEYAQGHHPGANSTPGGQLIQATDQYLAVRGARLVLCDADSVRAPVVGHWLKQMGWDVYILGPKAHSSVAKPPLQTLKLPEPTAELVSADRLAELAAAGAKLLDIRSSARFRERHLRGAVWATRRQLPRFVDTDGADTACVVITEDTQQAQLAAADLHQLGANKVFVFDRFDQLPASFPVPTQSTPDNPPDKDRVDFLFFVHDRHEGNKAAARQYLAWEINLLSQLDDQEKSAFRLAKPV